MNPILFGKKAKVPQQPRPFFFSAEEIKKMNKTEGSYQFKGDKDAKKTDTD